MWPSRQRRQGQNRGQRPAVGLLSGAAWYGLTASEWYQAKTTDLIQSVFLSAAAGRWDGRIIIEALFQLAHPTRLHIPQFHIWSRLPPHLKELNNLFIPKHQNSLELKNYKSEVNN